MDVKRGRIIFLGSAVALGVIITWFIVSGRRAFSLDSSECVVANVPKTQVKLPAECEDAKTVECADFCEEVICECDGAFYTNYTGTWKGDKARDRKLWEKFTSEDPGFAEPAVWSKE